MEKHPMLKGYKKELDLDEVEKVLKELLSISCDQGRFPDKASYEEHMQVVSIQQNKLNRRIYNLLRPLLNDND